MSLLNILGISDAFAQAATTTASTAPVEHAQGNLWSLLPTLILFILVFYFLLIRPQTKRAKEHRRLVESLAPGDEIVTNGGVTGKIVELQDNFVVVKIAKEVDVTFQKNAVAMVLPKGTLKTV